MKDVHLIEQIMAPTDIPEGWKIHRMVVAPHGVSYAAHLVPVTDQPGYVADVLAPSKVLFPDGSELSFEERPILGCKLKISPDGSKAMFVMKEGSGYTFYLNGEEAFRLPYDVVHYIGWIDSEQFVCDAFNDSAGGVTAGDQQDEGVRYFINGVDRTDVFSFTLYGSVPSGNGGLKYVMRSSPEDEMAKCFYVKENGAVEQLEDVVFEGYHPLFADMNAPSPRAKRSEPLVKITQKQDCVDVEVPSGQIFNYLKVGLPSMSGLFESKDRSRYCVVAMRQTPAGQKLSKFNEVIVNWAIGGENISGFWRLMRYLLFPFAWLIALAANPYFGPLHVAQKQSERWYLLLDGVEYGPFHGVGSCFFTKGNVHVASVTMPDSKQARVLVDNKHVREWDSVSEIMEHPVTGKITYLANKSGFLYRVVVTP